MPSLWRAGCVYLENGLATRHGTFVPLFDLLLAKHYHEQNGIYVLAGFFRSVIVCVGLTFASIHQTVAAGFWILIRLAQMQDEYLPVMREEQETTNRSGEALTVNKLSQLTLMDSYIREVLRPLRSSCEFDPMFSTQVLCLTSSSRGHMNIWRLWNRRESVQLF